MSPQWRGWAVRVAATVFGVAVIAGIAAAMGDQDWHALARMLRLSTLPALLVAVGVTAIGLRCGMRSWTFTLAALGSPVPRRAGARMFVVGFLGKFVPGRLWGLVAQIAMGQRLGVPRARMLGTYVLNLVVVFVTAGAVGLLVAPVLPGPTPIWVAPSLLVVALLVARPHLVNRLARAAARLTRRPDPEPLADPAALRRSIVLQTVSWVLSGAHVWVIAVLLGADPLAAGPAAVGGYALAAAAGTLAIVVPDGAGVRELVLLAALTVVLPWPAAVTTAIASRIVSTLAEVLWSVGVLLLTANRFSPLRRPREAAVAA